MKAVVTSPAVWQEYYSWTHKCGDLDTEIIKDSYWQRDNH